MLRVWHPPASAETSGTPRCAPGCPGRRGTDVWGRHARWYASRAVRRHRRPRRSVARSAGKTANRDVRWVESRPPSLLYFKILGAVRALRRRAVAPGAMLTERPSSRKAPVAEAENIPPPPRRGGRPSKPVDAAGLLNLRRRRRRPGSRGRRPCGEGHRSVESQYQTRSALDADGKRPAGGGEGHRRGRREGGRARVSPRRMRELERELEDARAAADPNDDDDDDRRRRRPATLAMVRRLRQEPARRGGGRGGACAGGQDPNVLLGAPDETELSAVRVEIDRTRARWPPRWARYRPPRTRTMRWRRCAWSSACSRANRRRARVD